MSRVLKEWRNIPMGPSMKESLLMASIMGTGSSIIWMEIPMMGCGIMAKDKELESGKLLRGFAIWDSGKIILWKDSGSSLKLMEKNMKEFSKMVKNLAKGFWNIKAAIFTEDISKKDSLVDLANTTGLMVIPIEDNFEKESAKVLVS